MLQGCVIEPKSASSAEAFQTVHYRLPKSAISATLSLTLEDCRSGPKVSGDVTLAAAAGASSQQFALTTAQLQSATVKRSLNITLQDTGTIATIDSATEDRTSAIIGNALKIVAGIAGAVAGAPAGGAPPLTQPQIPTLVCNDATMTALRRLAILDAALDALRSGPGSADPKEVEQRSKTIATLEGERGVLRSGPLHMEVTAKLDLDKLQPDPNGWRLSAPLDADALGPLVSAWLRAGQELGVNANWLVQLPRGRQVLQAGAQPVDQCYPALVRVSGICFVRPVDATISATLTSSELLTDDGTMEASASEQLPVPQWGTLQILPLSVGFGGNRELSMTLDKFGNVSEMKWTSEARAETITAGLAGVADQASTLSAAHTTLAAQKAEIDQLTTWQQLNKLRACKEVLAHGGYTCPE